MALAFGIFGSVDMNRGDLLLGWDTDQFPNSVPEVALALYAILQAGGFTTGGVNFDASCAACRSTPSTCSTPTPERWTSARGRPWPRSA
jgi:xylose isomerase